MCLIIKRQDPKIAEGDMHVYKVLRPNLHALMRTFRYYTGELQSTVLKESFDMSAADDTAANYLCDNVSADWYDNAVPLGLMSIGQGFHSCKTLERAELLRCAWGSSCKVYKCTIPDGSAYYEDPTGLLVSDNIIVNSEV